MLAPAGAKKVDVVGGLKVVSKAIKESVSTAGTAAAKVVTDKKNRKCQNRYELLKWKK
ncbi:hypothetical protein [Flavobacterium sp.]|jgi:hypothetical protein|uniref:hypothetical protein n=1 Tax=Flavobacterium sp. TaxID=239 RepID=UPI0025F94ACB|nr:hypothetical protein [Flavobacterium sp.]